MLSQDKQERQRLDESEKMRGNLKRPGLSDSLNVEEIRIQDNFLVFGLSTKVGGITI